MSDGKSETLPFTGERYVPEMAGDIALEHRHRYAVASEWVSRRDVLDLACGEGYGSALLAERARRVIGVDVSLQAVRHARERYRQSNVSFVAGACDAVPVASQTVDVVVSFETLEHVALQSEMLREIKRVLRPGGLLIMSSPDRYAYSELTGYRNPYHVQELSAQEFAGLIGAHFDHVSMLGQRVVYGSAILAEPGRPTRVVCFRWDGTTHLRTEGVPSPLYLIALASDGRLPVLRSGLFEQPIDHSQVVNAWAARLAESEATATALRESLDERTSELGAARHSVEGLSEQNQALLALADKGSRDLVASQRLVEERSRELIASQRLVEERSRELGASQQAVEDLIEQVADARTTAQEQSARLAVAERALSAQEARLTTLSEHLEVYERDLGAARRTLAARDAHANALRYTLVERERQLAELSAVRQERDRLRVEIDALRASTSWRITAPIRRARMAMREARHAAARVLTGEQAIGRVARAVYRNAPVSQRMKVRMRERLLGPPPAAGLEPRSEAPSQRETPRTAITRDVARERALHRAITEVSRHCVAHGPVSHVLALPLLSTGGAEMTAVSFARAIIEHQAAASVLVVVADRPVLSDRLTLPAAAKVLVLEQITGDESYAAKEALLGDLVVALRPAVFHTINSEVGWNVVLARGTQLSRLTRIFGSIFALQFTPDDAMTIGYAATYLRRAIPHLTGLLTDNQRFVEDAVTRFGLESERWRFHAVYNASRVLEPGVTTAARARLAALAARRTLDVPRVLWAGRLDEEKRGDLFLEAVRLCPHATFDMYGQSVVDGAAPAIHAPNLTYRGPFTSPLDIVRDTSYDAFMFTSRWEGMPNMLLEIGALGIPIIAPAVGGVPELINDETGYLLPARPSPEAYRDALAAIAADPAEAAARGMRLVESIETRHSWAAFSSAVAQVPGYLA